ncbi:MAG: hypothetical protein B7Y39_14215 [Bdellovibrio sp. 28-41-41]|nr:MAG: hypothetical protein B7Y39_14215 [Bdellovibrio sp. 28-41-41]
MSTSVAATVPPPSQKITFEEYRDLIKLKVSQVPDLDRLWSWNEKEKLKGFYFGGGAFRGLIVWIHTQLASHSLETVKTMKVPDVTGLLIQKDADRDIYTPDNYKESIKKWQPYANWDVLNESFYQMTIANAGSTLDKVRANPKWVDDPLNALDLLYHGKISISMGSPPFQSGSGGPIEGDSWLGLSLRYLRFTNDLGTVVDPQEGSLDQIREMAEKHANWIPNNTATDLAKFPWGDANGAAAFRIRKALDKFYKSNKTMVAFYQQIKGLNLLPLLAAKHYNIITQSDDYLATFLTSARKNGFTFKEMWQIVQMHIHGVNTAIRFHQQLFTLAQTNEERLLALTMFYDVTSDDYKNSFSEFLIKLLSGPNDLNLSLEELIRLQKQVNRINGNIALKKVALNSAKAMADAIEILKPHVDNPNEDYKKELRKLVASQIDLFTRLPGKTADVHALEVQAFDLKFSMAIKRASVKKASTPEELISVISPAFGNPSVEYLNGIREIYKTQSARFMSMKPTGLQLTEFFKYVSSTDTLSEKTEFLLSTKSKSDFELVLSLMFLNTHPTYPKSMEAVLVKLAPNLLELGYTTMDYNQLRGKLMLPTISDLDSPVRGQYDRQRQRARAAMSCQNFYKGAHGF